MVQKFGKYDQMSRAVLIFLASLLVLSSATPTAAEGYDPDEFLNLDLSKAVLSPKPLGPANTFGTAAPKVRAEGDAAIPQPRTRSPLHRLRTVHARSQTPRGAARNRLAHHHRNPLDAQAMDARIQIWPCKSGAICRWKQ